MKTPPHTLRCSILLALVALTATSSRAQQFHLPSAAVSDSATLAAAVPQLAGALLATRMSTDSLRHLSDRVRLLLATGDVDSALATIAAIRSRPDAPAPQRDPALTALEIHARALRTVAESRRPFRDAYVESFRLAFNGLSDRVAFEVSWYLDTPPFIFERNLRNALARAASGDSLSRADATALVRNFVMQRAMHGAHEFLPALLAADVSRRYAIDSSITLRTRDGATLSAVVVRPRNATAPLPSALNFTIYTDLQNHLQVARTAASHGYVGIVADARGKRLSRDAIRPYETEASDTHAVLDWITAQTWSDGRVGMFGGSYEGFAAWAATKRKHPALRTIATYVSAIPGQGLPMENNVFLNANYAWPFYVSNSRTLDTETYNDRARWQALPEQWFSSGRPLRDIDAIDSTKNPWLQKWLDHPTYDDYWQQMVPYDKEFANIDIPVLSITGYFDDGQISAIHYAKEHLRHRPDAEHYFVIGPYDHFGAAAAFKPANVRGYTIDPVAQFDGSALTFEWFDHVFHGAPRPSLLRDRVNHQVMGANVWRHAPSFDALNAQPLQLFFTNRRLGAHFALQRNAPVWVDAQSPTNVLERRADLADRTTQHAGYYPSTVVGAELEFGSALTFITEPFNEPHELSGTISGVLRAATNKRDFDFSVGLYELMPDGQLFHLTYFLGRASHAKSMSARQLLTPNEVTDIPFERSRMTSRRVQVGSRLLVVIDINKDAMHQVNHGTGGDVSRESALDAGEPLVLRLVPGSVINLPIRPAGTGNP
jgi:putative CocE/NonD family hydrolase